MVKQQSKRQQSKRRKHRGGDNLRTSILNQVAIAGVQLVINELNNPNISSSEYRNKLNDDKLDYFLHSKQTCQNNEQFAKYVNNLITIINSNDAIITPKTKIHLTNYVNSLENCPRVEMSPGVNAGVNAGVNPGVNAGVNLGVNAVNANDANYANDANDAIDANRGGAAKRRKSRKNARTHKRK